MKMVFITFNEAINAEVMDALASNGIETYTLWNNVLGSGKTSGPHLMTHIWPKANNVIMTGCRDEQAAGVMACVRKLRETLGHEGVKAFVMPLEEMT